MRPADDCWPASSRAWNRTWGQVVRAPFQHPLMVKRLLNRYRLLLVPDIEPHETLVAVLNPEATSGLDGDVGGRVVASQPVIGPGLAPGLADGAAAIPGGLIFLILGVPNEDAIGRGRAVGASGGQIGAVEGSRKGEGGA